MADEPVKQPDPPLAEAGLPIALSPATYARHDAVVRYVERLSRTPTPRDLLSRRPWTSGATIAKASSSIGARSGATYGTGTATLQYDTGSALADETNDTDDVDVKNMTDKTIASGAYVFVAWALGSWWVVVPGSCSNLS